MLDAIYSSGIVVDRNAYTACEKDGANTVNQIFGIVDSSHKVAEQTMIVAPVELHSLGTERCKLERKEPLSQ